MTALILALSIVAQTGPLTDYPTGVVVERLPGRPGFQASGDRARQYVRETIAQTVYADDPVPEAAPPWLILIGPTAETSQIESQIPDDLKTAIQVAKYEPNDARLDRGFRQHYPGGTYAILMSADRQIAWKGLADIAEILRQLNRLLKREPEPSPWLPVPPIPIPLPSLGGSTVFWAGLIGFVAGLFGRAITVAILRSLKSQIRELVKEVTTEPQAESQARRQSTPKS